MDYEYLSCPVCGCGVTVDKVYENSVGDDHSQCPECGAVSPDEDWEEYDIDFDLE